MLISKINDSIEKSEIKLQMKIHQICVQVCKQTRSLFERDRKHKFYNTIIQCPLLTRNNRCFFEVQALRYF